MISDSFILKLFIHNNLLNISRMLFSGPLKELHIANKGENCKTKTRPGILWPEKARSNCMRQLHRIVSGRMYTACCLLLFPTSLLLLSSAAKTRGTDVNG